MKISPARIAAFEILKRVELNREKSSDLLDEYAERLSSGDRALCHNIVLGVLRNQLLLDAIIKRFAPKKIDDEIRIILRTAFYQLKELERVPAYSILNDSVELALYARKRFAKGFVNAVLRKFSTWDGNLNINGMSESISVQTGIPLWLLNRWQDQFGDEKAAQIAKASAKQPTLSYRATCKTVPSLLPEIKTQSVSIERQREMFLNGEIYFQSLGSQKIADLVKPKTGQNVIDLCAAPGGKVSKMFCDMGRSSKNATFFANDVSLKRVRKMRHLVSRQGAADIGFLCCDAARELPFRPRSFDWVLVDAPCSGTGTMASNPEIKYFLDEKEISRMQHRQINILNRASYIVKQDGFIVYATCSLETEENEAVVERFLAENSEFCIHFEAIEREYRTKEGFLRIFPGEESSEGYFAAVLQRC